MSVVIKSDEFNYKDSSSGEYIGINVIAERSVVEQLEAIEAKGEETIESIPEDYTILSSIVEALKVTDYNESGTLKATAPIYKRQGTFSSANLVWNISGYHICYPAKPGSKLTIKANSTDYTAIAALTDGADPVAGASVPISEVDEWTSIKSVQVNVESTFTLPADIKYLYILIGNANGHRMPVKLQLDGRDLLTDIWDDVLKAIDSSSLFKGILTSEDNLDTIFDLGCYRWVSGSIPQSAPVNDIGGVMLVLHASKSVSAGAKIQMVIDASSRMHVRYITAAGSAPSWKTLATINQIQDVVKSQGILDSDDDLNDILENGVYYWTSSSVPSNAPFPGGSMVTFNAKTTANLAKFQIACTKSRLAYRYYSSDGWDEEWTDIRDSESMNLVNMDKIVTGSDEDVTIIHNSDGSITISTVGYLSYADKRILSGAALKPNTLYQLSMEVVSCEASEIDPDTQEPVPSTSWIALKTRGDWTGQNHIVNGIYQRTQPGLYRGCLYTSGDERGLYLFISGQKEVNATLTIKNIMVAESNMHLPYIPYGRTASDLNAIGKITSLYQESQSWGVSNAIARARQMAYVRYMPIENLPSHLMGSEDTPDDEYFPANNLIMGVAYSSARANDKMVGVHVSLYTFLSAICNPRSVLYTRELTHRNAKTYYGIVCSALVSYIYGINANYTTETLRDWPDLEEISFLDLRAGDIVVSSSHTRFISDVIRDDYGRIEEISTIEAGTPVVYPKDSWPWDIFCRNNSEYKAYRYKYINRVEYQSQLPYVKGFLDEDVFTPGGEDFKEIGSNMYFADQNIVSEYGDKAAISSGEDIAINVLNSDGYDTIEVYIDDSLVSTRSSLEDFVISDALPGHYRIVMSGTSKECVTEFIVVDLQCSYDSDTHILTFHSDNAEPQAIYTYSAGDDVTPPNPVNHYISLTQEQLDSGEIDMSNYVSSSAPYVKIGFKTEYGIATWYSRDLHYWRYCPIIFDDWIRGGVNTVTGALTTTGNNIRRDSTISVADGYTDVYLTDSTMAMVVLAYQNGEYVGAYFRDGTFKKQTGASFVNSFDLTRYPNYDFIFILYNRDYTQVAIEQGSKFVAEKG